MVRTGGALSIREDAFPLVGALVVNTVKGLIENGLNNGPKVG
jgi:hypothetical protein